MCLFAKQKPHCLNAKHRYNPKLYYINLRSHLFHIPYVHTEHTHDIEEAEKRRIYSNKLALNALNYSHAYIRHGRQWEMNFCVRFWNEQSKPYAASTSILKARQWKTQKRANFTNDALRILILIACDVNKGEANKSAKKNRNRTIWYLCVRAHNHIVLNWVKIWVFRWMFSMRSVACFIYCCSRSPLALYLFLISFIRSQPHQMRFSSMHT